MSGETGPNLSMAEAGKAMGFKGKPSNVARKTKRIIKAKERRIKRQILLRTGGDGAGVRYVVTLWSLKRWLPEYFDRRDQVAEQFRKYAADIEEKLRSQQTEIEHLGELFRELLDRLQAAES